jgi:hypothetical protein
MNVSNDLLDRYTLIHTIPATKIVEGLSLLVTAT